MISQQVAVRLQRLDPEPVSRSTILVVDGDAAQADHLTRQLRQQGYRTQSAHCGREALAVVQRDVPHLVVMDVRLPDTDGMRVCVKLADEPATCGIPIILLSSMTRPDIIRCSRAAGCEYYVRKPYDPNALLTLIQHSLGRTRGFGGPLPPSASHSRADAPTTHHDQ